MWEMDYNEGWVLKNWCFWIVVLEKTPESLGLQDQTNHLTGNQPRIFIGRTDAKAEASILWPPYVKNQLTGKDYDARKRWGQEEKVVTEDEMVGWHHRLSGHEFEQTLEDSPSLSPGKAGVLQSSTLWVMLNSCAKSGTWVSDGTTTKQE